MIIIFESTLKTDELHKMEYFGCDHPMRSKIDSAVPRNQYRKACPTQLVGVPVHQWIEKMKNIAKRNIFGFVSFRTGHIFDD